MCVLVVRWCRIINTVRAKEHSTELAGGYGSNVQSLDGGVQGQGGGFKAGLETEGVLLSPESQRNCRSGEVGP